MQKSSEPTGRLTAVITPIRVHFQQRNTIDIARNRF